MNRAQIEVLLDKLAADNAAGIASATSPVGPDHTQRVATILILQALAGAFQKVLEVLVKQHNGVLGQCFDDVERAAIEDAMQAVTSGTNDMEAALAATGVRAVEEAFSDFRAQTRGSQLSRDSKVAGC